MTSLIDRQTSPEADASDTFPRVLVAREGSELAERLLARGWRPSAGWRHVNEAGETIWYVRYEAAERSVL
ncbi:MAG: hypothetical protein DCC58_19570 [Chloroflexi bacterium]|nr:MAG: hypothetical protein DCC58_19570 [Chloroflexota bacterium]